MDASFFGGPKRLLGKAAWPPSYGRCNMLHGGHRRAPDRRGAVEKLRVPERKKKGSTYRREKRSQRNAIFGWGSN